MKKTQKLLKIILFFIIYLLTILSHPSQKNSGKCHLHLNQCRLRPFSPWNHSSSPQTINTLEMKKEGTVQWPKHFFYGKVNRILLTNSSQVTENYKNWQYICRQSTKFDKFSVIMGLWRVQFFLSTIRRYDMSFTMGIFIGGVR